MLVAYLLGFCFCCSRLVLLPALFVLVGFVFSFSLTDYTQKERAQILASSLRVLWLLYLRIAAAFLSATAAARWHSRSVPKKGGICGNSGINTIKQSFKGCFSIFAN